jgi:hypothetical protein
MGADNVFKFRVPPGLKLHVDSKGIWLVFYPSSGEPQRLNIERSNNPQIQQWCADRRAQWVRFIESGYADSDPDNPQLIPVSVHGQKSSSAVHQLGYASDALLPIEVAEKFGIAHRLIRGKIKQGRNGQRRWSLTLEEKAA